MGFTGEDSDRASHWYAIRTKPNQEDRAGANLRAWQVQTFTPKLRERQTSGFGGHYISKPLFSRYIFAHFAANRILHQINYTRGVENVVSFGGTPAPIDDKIIDFIREQVGDDGFIRLDEQIQFGDRIRINSGPFKGLVGIFQENSNDTDRVRILLDAVKYQNQLEIDRELIERDTTHPASLVSAAM